MFGEVCSCQNQSITHQWTNHSKIGAPVSIVAGKTGDKRPSELESELSLAAPHCFIDSTVALRIGFEKDWKPFVQNRVSEIRKLTPTNCWRHCAGQDNPADIPSRGLGPLELSVSVFWRSGPDWLKDRTWNR